MFKINNIPFPLQGSQEELFNHIAGKSGIPFGGFTYFKILKKSTDARDKGKIHFVYSVGFEVEEKYQQKALKIAEKVEEKLEILHQTHIKASKTPVVVGMGPAGIFATYALCLSGNPPIVLERGKEVMDRVEDVNHFFEKGILNSKSNVQFGEGGAGTFSDGKLTTGIKSPFSKKVLELFVECGAPEEILYLQKPHIGTDVLRKVVINIRKKLQDLGTTIYFESQVIDMVIEKDHVKEIVWIDKKGEEHHHFSDNVFLAIGHSARDTYRMLHQQGIEMEQKPFAIGARIEHPQKLINEAQYGKKYATNSFLGAAEYKLHTATKDGRGIYTFCMCPGGQVIPSASSKNTVVTNGMSLHSREQINANAALLVGIRPEDFKSDHPLAGIDFQEKFEKKAFTLGEETYYAPVQRVEDFLLNKASRQVGEVFPSYQLGVIPSNLADCLPDYVVENMRQGIIQFDRKLRGFAFSGAILTGVETRSSAPVRILRNSEYEANIKGIYPIGEGAGYAGGIMSAAVDGYKVAQAIFTKRE